MDSNVEQHVGVWTSVAAGLVGLVAVVFKPVVEKVVRDSLRPDLERFSNAITKIETIATQSASVVEDMKEFRSNWSDYLKDMHKSYGEIHSAFEDLHHAITHIIPNLNGFEKPKISLPAFPPGL